MRTTLGISNETKEHLKFLKKTSADQKVRKDKVCNEYYRLVKTQPDEEVIPALMERFDVKRSSTIHKWLQARSGALNPASKAVNDVMVLEQMGRLLESAQEYDSMLINRIEELDELDGDWVSVEQTEDSRGTSTKKISRYEALKQASKERVQNGQEFFKAARAIIPQTVLNQVIDNRKDADNYTDAELDKLLNGEVK